ncbi:MAG TPA: SRPBCC domain-containing protein [Candidatus Eisenbacteria bacterium]|nr:SRPBCC domain-containing protein [Candidatus Eisenbacteria bacterium]
MAPKTQDARRRVTLERTFAAPIDEVWELWTTKEGIESWWGPDGFAVKVHQLDLRPGGELVYAMTATALDQIEFLKKAGMPATTVSRLTYTEVVPPRRLAYSQTADFIPGVEPYEVPTTVELETTPQGVRMVLTFSAMHDEHWTNMAVMGWESELGRLEKLLKA